LLRPLFAHVTERICLVFLRKNKGATGIDRASSLMSNSLRVHKVNACGQQAKLWGNE
jgi:hypothetical protein